MPRGFLLDHGYRHEQDRAVVTLHGVLEDGSSFLAEVHGVEAGFFTLAADRERVRALAPAADPEPTAHRSMDGEPVDRVQAPTPARAARLRETLEREGLVTFEGDVRFSNRFLIDRGIRGSLDLEGASAPAGRIAHRFVDPELAPGTFEPELRVLSLDIETDPDARRLFSFALHGAGADARAGEVHLVAGGSGALPGYATEHPDEAALLAALERRMVELDPDVLTGWNLIGFDLMVLERRAKELGTTLRLGRGSSELRLRLDGSFWGASRAEIEGRAVLDGVNLLRGAFIAVEDHRLETVAQAMLGEGKLLHGSGRADEIERQFREDRAAFCAYNLRDAELVTRIIEKTGLVRLAVRRARITGMTLDRVSSSIASFDALYLPELRARGFVAPNVGAGASAGEDGATAGGAVLEPVAGMHSSVLAFDFKSLYPTVIRTFNIDPLTRAADGDPATDLIRTPAGVSFRREPGILPGILERLMSLREQARKSGDAIASQATKILMNSFYGVLAAPACRFHSTRLANAITGTGQALLYWTRDRAEALGYRVLYGDTDSLFVASGADRDDDALTLGSTLAARLTGELREHIQTSFGVASHLELQFDGLWRKLFFPHMRHGGGGARKRYAGLLRDEGGSSEVVFVGMESVRRDWTAAAREFQRALYQRVFAGEDPEAVASFVREELRAVRSGQRDARLVYRKSLRKAAAEYTATTPPHVRAARLGGGDSRLIEYVMTSAGPEPLSARRSPLDYPHYIDKQYRPIAEAILPAIGLDWDAIADNPRQLPLF